MWWQVYPTRVIPLTRSGLQVEQAGGDAPADDWHSGDEAWGVRVELTAVSPSQDESESALSSVIAGGDHSGCTTPQSPIPPHRRLMAGDRDTETHTGNSYDTSLEVCNARVWLLEAQLDARELELRQLKQELSDARRKAQREEGEK